MTINSFTSRVNKDSKVFSWNKSLPILVSFDVVYQDLILFIFKEYIIPDSNIFGFFISLNKFTGLKLLIHFLSYIQKSVSLQLEQDIFL